MSEPTISLKTYGDLYDLVGQSQEMLDKIVDRYVLVPREEIEARSAPAGGAEVWHKDHPPAEGLYLVALEAPNPPREWYEVAYWKRDEWSLPDSSKGMLVLAWTDIPRFAAGGAVPEAEAIIRGWAHHFPLPATKVPGDVLIGESLREATLVYALKHGLIDRAALFPAFADLAKRVGGQG